MKWLEMDGMKKRTGHAEKKVAKVDTHTHTKNAAAAAEEHPSHTLRSMVHLNCTAAM